MSITDELREYALGWDERNRVRCDLTAIADRIDAEHEKACEDAWNNGYEADYLGIEKWLTEHPQVMEHHDWMRLPKDADGEPIHQGELVEYRDHSGTWHEETTVAAITDVGCYVWAGAHLVHVWGNDCRHHHAPTVEDVLREFADECLTYATCVEDHEVTDAIERFAAKLRMAGDAE